MRQLLLGLAAFAGLQGVFLVMLLGVAALEQRSVEPSLARQSPEVPIADADGVRAAVALEVRAGDDDEVPAAA